MAYDEGLAERMRELLEEREDIVEKKMFGGLSFLLNGNLSCGIIKEELIVRVGPDREEECLEDENARPFDFTGRPMKGWITVSEDGFEEDEDLEKWIKKGVAFASTLPSK